MNAIDYFARTNTLHIATAARRGGEVVTPVWGVTVDGTPYIRSAYGEDAKWYRRVRRTGEVSFVDGPDRYRATLENVHDEQVIQQVDAAYEAKYADHGESLRQVVSGLAREYTLRVILP